MKTEITVSICCNTYNHEKYISDALDGFLAQKTNFKYEVIVYDDASTDNTQKIIKKYQKKYPKIIKPILQKENQYSKGINVFEMALKKTKGKYIAVCEGDDYWIDPMKLQRQVDVMEKNPDVSLCFHDSKVISDKNNDDSFLCKSSKDGEISINKLILNGGLYCATASLMFHRKYAKNLPNYYYYSKVGDYPLQLYLASQGKVYFINKKMCVYRRIFNNESWTANFNKNIENKISNCLNEISWLLMFNEDNKNIYKKAVYQRIATNYLVLAQICNKKYLKKYIKKYLKFSKYLKFNNKLHNYIIIIKLILPKRIKKILKKGEFKI